MPRILKYIDEISRRLSRDVLIGMPDENIFRTYMFGSTKAQKKAMVRCMETHRRAVKFLKREGISWEDCFGIEQSNFLIRPWFGEMFIDIPNDPQDIKYKKVCSFFENKDGSPKFRHYHIFILPYEVAVSNRDRCERNRDIRE